MNRKTRVTLVTTVGWGLWLVFVLSLAAIMWAQS